MKKIIAGIIILIVLGIIGGLYINNRIKISKLNDKLQQAIGKDQGLTETILKIESESQSISYSEFFDLCEKSVAERTDLIVELRGLYPDMESQLKESLIEFFNNENELVRSKSQFYRKQMNISTSIDIMTEYVNDYTYSEYSYDYFKTHLASLKKELYEHADEMIDNISIFRENFNSLITKEKDLALLMKKAKLRFLPIYEKYNQSTSKYLDESEASANQIIKDNQNI